MRVVEVAPGVSAGGEQFLLIGGPCVVESTQHTLEMAAAIQSSCRRAGMGFVFKASFDKANRTSLQSFRGKGFEQGLAALAAVKAELGVPVLSDVHESWQVAPVSEVCDVLQIPAFLCRQTDLLAAAARSGRIVNVKKGQFLSPQEMRHVAAKLEDAGAEGILLTERGTSFGYNALIVDFRGLPTMRGYGWPVIFDATHSVQEPGGAGAATSGRREYVPYLVRGAVAVGVEGLFMEIHDDPDRAPSDGPNMLRLADLDPVLESVVALRQCLDPLPPLDA